MATESTGPPAASNNPLRVFRHRAYARLFSAGATSTAGQTIGALAMTWLVYSETGSAIDLAYLGVVGVAAGVGFSLFAGSIVDRSDRRRLMIIADLVRAASLGGLLLELVLFGFSLPAVLGAAFLLGTFSTLFGPAERSYTPSIVPPEDLADANALTLTANSLLQFGGAGGAGVLIGIVGIPQAIALNCITFLLSAALIASIAVGVRRVAAADDVRPGFIADTRAGLAYLGGRTQRGLLWLTVSAGTTNFFGAVVFTFLVVYTTQVLHGGPGLFGAINGALALGFAPGAILAGRLHSERYAGALWVYGSVATGVCLLGVAAVPIAPVTFALMLGLGLLFGWMNTAWLTTVQFVVPPSMQGRYFGLDQVGSFAVIPAGQLVGGYLIAAHGIVWALYFAAIGWLVTAALGFLPRSLRSWRYEGPGAAAPPPPLRPATEEPLGAPRPLPGVPEPRASGIDTGAGVVRAAKGQEVHGAMTIPRTTGTPWTD